MLASSVLLAVPWLLTAAAHPNPLAAPHRQILRDINVAAESIPEGHLGFPPQQYDYLEAIAGMSERDETKPMKKLRRRKRSCQVSLSSNSTSNNDAVSASAPDAQPSAADSSANASTTVSVPSASASDSAAEPSASSASETSSSSSNATSSSVSSGPMDFIFPVGSGSASWTTSDQSSSAMSFNSALNPLQYGKLPSQGNAPDGTTALIANYPAGSVDFANGAGYSFYTQGNVNNVNVEGANEVMFTYSVFFPTGFDFVKGGKLPGIYGGTSLSNAKSCSGGRQTDRDSCFSARTMWRTNGMGEIYNYLPTTAAQANSGYCSTPPFSTCNPDYGDSIGRGSFYFSTNAWTTVAQRFKMNDMGQSNGEQELYVNGTSMIQLNNMQYAQEDGFKFYGIMAQTFFGGNDASWAPPSDCQAYFKDWSLAILA